MVYIEVWDSYEKQSYRNRTCIYGANGKQDLVIPVKRPGGNNTLTRDIMLDYDMPWHQVHWKSIVSAYGHSPFFEIFEPELAPFFVKKMKYLLDWNFGLLDRLFSLAGITVSYQRTENFIKPDSEKYLDLRDSIHPKKRRQKSDSGFAPSPYFQVFSEKLGFIPDLSFIDLLFNEGSDAVYLCRKYCHR